MSTRSNIIVKDERNKIQLYRHCDGYPEGVIPDLKEALPFAWELPRMEADDMAAAIVRAWKQDGGNVYIDGVADLPESLHGDIDYYYVIEPDKEAGRWSVECHAYSEGYEKTPTADEVVWRGYIGDDYTCSYGLR